MLSKGQFSRLNVWDNANLTMHIANYYFQIDLSFFIGLEFHQLHVKYDPEALGRAMTITQLVEDLN